MAMRGGKREGSGRKLTAPDGMERKMRSIRASDAEWQLMKNFEILMKHDFEKAQKLINGID